MFLAYARGCVVRLPLDGNAKERQFCGGMEPTTISSLHGNIE